MTKENQLTDACEIGNYKKVKELVENNEGIINTSDIALACASLNGYLEIVKYLVENGANAHAWNNQALHWASEHGHLHIVKYLKMVTRKEKFERLLAS